MRLSEVAAAAGGSGMVPVGLWEQSDDALWQLYDRAYEVTPAACSKSVAEVSSLRYQVYCLERGFEDPSASPQGLEQDAFDARSLHCLLRHRETRVALGTGRLILPDPARPRASWPIQQVCHDPRILDERVLPLAQTAEVSRFCLSTEARRQVRDLQRDAGDDERVAPFALLGIVRGLLALSLQRGITHWAMVGEPRLLRLLGRLGLHFEPLGPLVEYHGQRQPCCRDIAGLLEGMRQQRPELWRIVTAGGSLTPPEALMAA